MIAVQARRICATVALSASLLVAAVGCGPSPAPGASRPVPRPSGLPLGGIAAAPIGASGGGVTSLDARVELSVPTGAISASQEFSIQEITNTAPAGLLSAYRIGPAGATFAVPVTLTFHAELVNASLDEVTVAYQDESGYWIRLPSAVRDASARTLTVTTSHFSDWSLVTGVSPRDMSGVFTISSTLDIPFTADGTATLAFAGENAVESFYLLGGSEVPRAPVTVGGLTCTPAVPTLALFTNVAELKKTPLTFEWGTSGHWDLACSDASHELLLYAFDTLGMTEFGCSRSYVGPQTLGQDRLAGSYTIDCGPRGTLSGTWAFQTAACGQPCASSNLCHAAVSVCATGTAVCTDTGDLANGTPCGTDLVCNGGTCSACSAGLVCGTQPEPLCHAGVTSCATGSSSCENGAALLNGTPCGTDMVCNGGTCTACTAGLVCGTQPDVLCHAGVTSCATGTSTCENGAALLNGTGCGTDMVCDGGVCGACTAGLACGTQPDLLCHAGVTSCATGTSTCENGASLANGTACGAGQTCNAGGCVASRIVTGTRLVTRWPDAGAPVAAPAPDVTAAPLATVAALVARGGGGFDTYAGTLGAAGDVSIPNVPIGTYLLSFVDGNGVHTFLETSASAVDLGVDLLGRSNVTKATLGTPVTLDVTGLTAWTAGDRIQLTSSNGDVFDVPSLGTTMAASDTALHAVDDWAASALGPALNLLEPADVLWAHDLAAGVTTQTTGATTYPYLFTTNAASVTGLGFTDGSAAGPVAMALAAAPGVACVTGASSTGIDWRLSQFEAELTALTGLTVMPAGSVHTLSIGAAAHALANPAPVAAGNPTLFELQLAAGTGDFLTATGPCYGQFLDAALWSEWRGLELTVPVSYTISPATIAFTDRAAIGRREAMFGAPPTPIVPTVLAVRSPAINGSGAFASLTGVTTTPTLSWSAPPTPASAAPTSYTVEIVSLAASGTATVATPVARWRVASTSVAVPPNLLVPGATYYARITANVSSPDPLVTKPLSGEHVTAYATALTGTFSP